MDSTPKTPALYTVREVAEALRVHSRTAYRLITQGDIKAIKIGSQWRVPERALMDYIESGWRKSLREKPQAGKGPRQLKLPM
ncbi:MAG: helix-turn-helix domain-containing protein [Desulfovibrionaceae bacterium]|nr:helix-turn-helix domain-containing protein [Desulfovibrionaceae bacterium]